MAAAAGTVLAGPIGATAGTFVGWAIAEETEDPPDVWADKTIYRCNLAEYCRTLTTFGSKCVIIYRGNGAYESFTASESVDKENSRFMEYAILYVLLVIETCIFLYTYLKRVFKLAFYTMIAPLIAFMYPIDKLGDGKAQAFNTWFKEYLFNVLVQPLHLLLYTVFIYAASELVRTNMIYAIGAFGYMIAAEKFFKKIFGFDKGASGGTPGLAGPAMSHALGHGLERLGGFGPPKPGGGKADGGSGKKPKIDFAKKTLGGGGNTPTSGGTSEYGGGSGSESGSVPKSGGAPKSSGVPGSGGRFANLGRNVKNGAKIIRGAGSSMGGSLARKLTGNKIGSLKDMKSLRGIGAIGSNVAKKGGRLALRAGTGIVGAGIGAMGGLVTGAFSSMLTGEDHIAQQMSAGFITGANRGQQFGNYLADKGGSLIQDGKNKLAEEDPDYAAKLKMDALYQEDPEFFNNMSKEDREEFQDLLSYTDKIDSDNKESVYKNMKSGEYSKEDIIDKLDAKDYNLKSTSGVEQYKRDQMEKVDISKATAEQKEAAEREAKKAYDAKVKDIDKQRVALSKQHTKERADAKAAGSDMNLLKKQQMKEYKELLSEKNKLAKQGGPSQEDIDNQLKDIMATEKTNKIKKMK